MEGNYLLIEQPYTSCTILSYSSPLKKKGRVKGSPRQAGYKAAG
jgi:hypothetical protein